MCPTEIWAGKEEDKREGDLLFLTAEMRKKLGVVPYVIGVITDNRSSGVLNPTPYNKLI